MAGKPPGVMDQYRELKRQAGDAILFFRVGDFYEMFYEDAQTASWALSIALTTRSKEDGIPMAGVPVKSVEPYLARMIAKGFRVAICEQVGPPGPGKGIFDREIVRIVTSGTLTEENVLAAGDHNYLAALHRDGASVGAAWVDLSTGTFWAEDFPVAEILVHLGRIDAREVLIGDSSAADQDQDLVARISSELGAAVTKRPDWNFRPDRGREKLTGLFQVQSLAGFGCDDLGPALGAAGALVAYLEETQKTELAHIRRIARYGRSKRMILDRATISALEIVRTMRDGERDRTLASAIDRTATAMGSRLLKDWILSPLLDVEEIRRRQDAVAELVEANALSIEIARRLRGIADMERIVAKVSCGRANPRDLASLGASLCAIPSLLAELRGKVGGEALTGLAGRIDPLEELGDLLSRAIADAPPIALTDGGIFRRGYHAQLDELREILEGSHRWLAEYQAREAERTKIESLKVGFNSVFGYYIEITHTHREKIPPEYVRKQTLKNAERYITPELKEYETRALSADEKAKKLEREIFEDLRRRVASDIGRILETTDAIAHLDLLVSFALVAAEHRYVRPEVDLSRSFEIEDGRHPVLERSGSGSFVPNDLALDEARYVVVLTGPNMAGKSTYIRQMALAALLAQIGSFVPAKRARIGLVDRIFTRIGSADEIGRGRSTFMVEMEETANILNNATDRSFVVLDEVGRGTSTFDGVAIAWAISEHLHDTIRCRTLFATHYHELTDLAVERSGVKNLNVDVREWNDEVIFLHRIVPGACDRSYGIHVGRLAGLPAQVIDRSREILHRLEACQGAGIRGQGTARKPDGVREIQLDLFSASRQDVLDALAAIDTSAITPLQALIHLSELQRRAR